MRAKPAAPEVIGESFGDFCDGQPAGIGCDDGAGLSNSVDFSEESAFELKVLDDGLDDPVNFGELRKVVFEVADGDKAREGGVHESGGF